MLEKIHTFTATTSLPIVSWNVSKYGSFIYPYFVMNSKGKFFPLSFKTVNERMSLLSTVFCMPCPSSVSSQRLVIRIKLASAFVNIRSNWSNFKKDRPFMSIIPKDASENEIYHYLIRCNIYLYMIYGAVNNLPYSTAIHL